MGIFFICQPICAQSPELKASFNKISSILKEYEIKTPETKFNSVSKNITCSFIYPYFTISYIYAYAPGWTNVPGEKPGKRIVKFSILDTNFSKGFDSDYGTPLYFKSESGIERTALGKKNLLSKKRILAPKKSTQLLMKIKYMQSKSKKRMKHRKKQISQLKTMSTNKL